MITVTAEAATQILLSAEQSQAQALPLRLAIEQKSDGRFHYIMGFDDQLHPGDQRVESAGVVLVVDGVSQPLANGLMLDYVELEGVMEFVFMNPNDPGYKPPQE